MRITVISDSHHRSGIIDKILSVQEQSRHIFFLGDNVTDIEDYRILYPDRIFHTVSGNCDYGSVLPTVGLEVLEGKKILYTHGHTLGVKYGMGGLIKAANESACDIVLYGHTHISKILYENGVYYVNPGSCSCPREGGPTYAVIDITPKGIMPITVKL